LQVAHPFEAGKLKTGRAIATLAGLLTRFSALPFIAVHSHGQTSKRIHAIHPSAMYRVQHCTTYTSRLFPFDQEPAVWDTVVARPADCKLDSKCFWSVHEQSVAVANVPNEREIGAMIGGAAGAPSAIQLCFRHPEWCSAVVVVFPIAFEPPVASAPEREALGAPAILMNTTLHSDVLFWA
jgi:hypothetical protein